MGGEAVGVDAGERKTPPMDTMTSIYVKKRDGRLEPFAEDKINQVVLWAVEGIKNVNATDVILKAKMNIKTNMATEAIHAALVRAAVNCFSVEQSNYQYVAERLLCFDLRKKVWGGSNPPKFYDFLKKVVEKKQYDPVILDSYSESEINKLDEYLDHDRDYSFTYAGLKQMMDKYLVQNRVTKEIYETPQFAFMAIAMTAFIKYPADTRITYVKRAYDVFSRFKANLPTPQIAGIRTPLRSYSSCCLVDVDDTMDSLFASNHAIGLAVAARYGIGINYGRIRSIGSEVRGGEVVHTGVIPFLKVKEATVKSCQQNGIRGGSATVNFPFWHEEIQDILVLKNNGGTEESRVRKMDYVIHISKMFYERFIKNEMITLFSPHQVRDLYDAFGYPEFDLLYEKYESDQKFKNNKRVPARELMGLLVKERVETGRIYVLHIDHVQSHCAWDVKAQMTNLCVEVVHPTKPISDIKGEDGEIGVCVLGAINPLEIRDEKDLADVTDIIVRFLEELIDHQTYFCGAAERFTKDRRSLAIGMNGLAGYLAKNGLKYSDSDTPNFVSDLQEKHSYYLLKASCNLAKEKGPCAKFNETKYSKGILPIDTYKKDLDEVVTTAPKMDWEGLRADIAKYGLRHSTLTAQMPCESSSVVNNQTNGVEPAREALSYKKSKVGSNPFLVPGYEKYKKNYEWAFDIGDNKHVLNVAGAISKWLDMAISTNVYYRYTDYPDGKLPDIVVIKDMLHAYKMGVPTLYYANSDTQTDMEGCESGACAI
jgi:ribonucleoside-diphosphate reductase alpha chain